MKNFFLVTLGISIASATLLQYASAEIILGLMIIVTLACLMLIFKQTFNNGK
jgi:hypothetical protein